MKKSAKSTTNNEDLKSYRITFKGLLSIALGCDLDLVQKVMDQLELYLRRNYMKDGEYGAIIFNGEKFIITSVEHTNNDNAKDGIDA